MENNQNFVSGNIVQPTNNQVAQTPLPQNSVQTTAPEGRRSWILSSLTVLVVILILATIGSWVYMNNRQSVSALAANGQSISIKNTPLVVEEKFMNDLFVGNYRGAYKLTSTNFQTKQSLANFTKTESSLNVDQLTLSSVTQKSSGSGEVVSGSISAQGDKLLNFSSTLVKQDGLWRVNDLELS